MSDSPNIAIIGAGPCGLGCARELVNLGHERWTVFERNDRPAGLAGSVDFLGSVPDIWDHLARADVFALASRSEAFGIAIAEAMAAGLPVVAPAVGAIPELVRPGETGELFPPGDAAAMADHLVRLLTSPDVRAGMSAAALAASESLHVEKAVERYFDLYAGLLQRQGLG